MLTVEEKAARFDELKTSFDVAREIFRNRGRDARRIAEKTHNAIGAYSLGEAEACEDFISYIERWANV